MASVGFRWLDILEKEFDKAFVDLDLVLGDADADLVMNSRQKLCTLASCFAQLSHKAQTVFQNSAKVEAELIHLRAELIESKTKKELLENELHNLLLQLHSSQLSQLPDSLGNKKIHHHFKPDVNAIKRRLEAEIRQSPLRAAKGKNGDCVIEKKVENAQLLAENTALRNDILALTAEVYGAKLAAKYLDKELAGRIQQLQLLGKEMQVELRDKLWGQLESEILLQRHKTVVRACRRNNSLNNSLKALPEPNGANDHFGDIRVVAVKRKPDQGLGISITGGREHGVPILISELEQNGPAALTEQLYIGDAILFVNDVDLRNVCHKEAVTILQKQSGDCVLQVQYIAADDSDNSLEEDGLNFRIFNDEICNSSSSSHTKEMVNTPTAPRTPESNSASRLSCASPQNLKEEEEEVDNFATRRGLEQLPNVSINNNTLNVDTSDLVLLDNTTNNIIKLEDYKNVDVLSTIESNFNCSANSLISDNMSSPMQTSTDVYLDSEVLSTDDSHSPKNQAQPEPPKDLAEKPEVYSSTESLAKSDHSLLNSDEESGSSPRPKLNRNYKRQKKVRKKYFGVKTLHSIFNKHEGYSDISATASEQGEPSDPKCTETSLQFDKQVHNIISDILTKGKIDPVKLSIAPSKKYFSFNGQSLRVGKALRLCPNEGPIEGPDQDQTKEKLLARYVYNASSLNVDGVGDPDFGTPV